MANQAAGMEIRGHGCTDLDASAASLRLYLADNHARATNYHSTSVRHRYAQLATIALTIIDSIK